MKSLKQSIFLFGCALLFCFLFWYQPGAAEDVPAKMNYQGFVQSGGSAFSGEGGFKFAIVDSAGASSYWSNDGSSTAGGEPTAAVTVTVTDGVFSVILGNTELTNMTALDKTIFSNGESLYLRVWFDDGTSGFQQLSPDTELAATAYALNSDAFDNTIMPTLTMDSDNTEGGSNIRIIANQGSDENGEIRYNAATNQWEFSNNGGSFSAFSGGGSSGVTGPGTSTDNALARFDGSGGATLQNSGVTVDDSNNLTTAAQVQAEQLVSTDDADITDNLTAGDLTIDEAAGVLAFSGATSAKILTTNAGLNTLTLGGSGQTNNEDLTLDFETTANKVLVASSTGVTSVDYQTVNLETDALDLSGGNITSVGNIALNVVSSAANVAVAPGGNLNIQPDGDADDYTYFSTDSNAAQLFWEGYSANDPGLRVNTTSNEIEYRDENESGWTSLDTLAGGDVSAAANLTDNAIVRGDGGAKGVQASGVTIDDSDNISTSGTLGAGAATVTSLNNSEGNITNVGDIALDSISADASNIAVKPSGAINLQPSGDTDDYLTVTTTGNEPIIGTSGSCDLNVTSSANVVLDLAATNKVFLDGTTTRTGSTELLDIDATIDTSTATTDVTTVTLTPDRAAADTGGTRGVYANITGSGNMANGEWLYNYGGIYNTSDCATATANAAIFYAGSSTADAQCNDYGVYVESGYDTAGLFGGTLQTGLNGADGQLNIYSEQGGTDYSVTVNPHAAMTENVTYTLPAADATSNGQVLACTTGGALSWSDAGTGAGDVDGPGSSTDNAVVRFDGTGGKTLQNSGVTIDDSNNISTSGTLGAGAATVTSLNNSEGNITNVGDIALDSISADASNIAVTPSGAINLQPSGDTDDYLIVATASNVPTISTAGSSNLNITASGGTISFNDENLSTSGTLGAGAATVTSLNNSEGNITNVGDIALDSISEDDTGINVTLGAGAGNDFIVDTNVLVVEGDDNRVGILTTDPTDTLHIVSGTAQKGLRLENTANILGSYLTFYHNLGSPSAGNRVGEVIMNGNNSAAEEEWYGSMYTRIADTTNGSEDGDVYINARVDGNNGVGRILLTSNELQYMSDASTSTLELYNDAADGDPLLSFNLSSDTPVFTFGVDDGDNDTLKIGTSAIGTNTMLALDSRTTTSGVSAHTLTGIGPTIASASGAEYTSITMTPPTINLTGTTQVTSQMDSVVVNAPTLVGDTATLTINDAATMTIAGAPVESTNIALTDTFGLKINAAAVGSATNSYGLYVDAPTGATNNYGAVVASGNVGIGTAAPEEMLHIVSESDPTLKIDPGSNDTVDPMLFLADTFAGPGMQIRYDNDVGSTYFDSLYDHAAGDIHFRTKVSGTPVNAMTIEAAGHVGIGTLVPDGFQVNAAVLESARSVDNVRLGIVADTPRIIFEDSASATLWEIDNSGGVMRIFNPGAVRAQLSTTKAQFNLSVGIGKDPDYQLELSTNSAGKPTSNTWEIVSDRRLKANIEPFTDGLDTILQIDPVSYSLNGKAGRPKGEEGISVIAQDVMDVVPYTISTFKEKLEPDDEEETELYSFDSSALTFVLINAVKELKAENDDLRARITDLENMMQ